MPSDGGDFHHALLAREAGEGGVEKRGEQLAHAVRAEVEAEHAIPVRHALVAAEDEGLDELVA